MERSLVRWSILVGVGIAVLVLMNVVAEVVRPEAAADVADSSDGDVAGLYAYHVIPTAAVLLAFGLIVAGWGARWATATRPARSM
ncbi:hypothetical protein NODU109028_01310 [Nocardioides dubius]